MDYLNLTIVHKNTMFYPYSFGFGYPFALNPFFSPFNYGFYPGFYGFGGYNRYGFGRRRYSRFFC